MTRRERLQQRLAEKQQELIEIQRRIADPATPGASIPGLRNQEANLERRINEIETELNNLPAEARRAATKTAARKTPGPKKKG